ncbi:MAG: DUF805 domain-containing protein [Oscillospiraceae bacterium]|nr:DUF805 domain-containing protein [Oscillospiraceae bacterium]
MEYVEKMKNLLLDALHKLSDFSGRISCPDFWWTMLGLLIVNIPLAIVFGLLNMIPVVGSILMLAYELVMLMVVLGLSVRRMNDAKGPTILPWLYVILTAVGAVIGFLAGLFSWSILFAIGWLLTVVNALVGIAALVAVIIFIYYAVQPSKE